MSDIQNKLIKNQSLRAFNSWRVGGSAEFFIEPTSLEDLKLAYTHAFKNEMPVTVLSQGTNVLVSEDGIPGMTICMRSFKKPIVFFDHPNLLKFEAYAGTTKSDLAKIFLQLQ